jgi:hypothetical protein
VNVADAEPPAGTVPTAADDGATVHPDGAFSDSEAFFRAAPAGFRSVSFTVNEDVARVVDGTAASVGAGAVGCPYTEAL